MVGGAQDGRKVEVQIKPGLPGQWRWKVKYGRSWMSLDGRKHKAGTGFGRQDAVNRAKAFLERKGLDPTIVDEASED